MPEELDNAVAAAVDELAVSPTPTETVETKTEEPEKSEGPDPRTAQALSLLDALENPKTAGNVVTELMKQLGISAPETKREEVKAVKTIKDTIRERLGDDFSFLSDKLGDALEEALASEREKIRSEFLSLEQQRAQRELMNDYNKFLSENKVSDDEAGALNKLVDEFPPSGNIPLDKYLGRLLKMHRLEAAEATSEIAKRQRQKENLSRRPETSGIESNEARISRGSRVISAKEAVEAALRGETLD